MPLLKQALRLARGSGHAYMADAYLHEILTHMALMAKFLTPNSSGFQSTLLTAVELLFSTCQ